MFVARVLFKLFGRHQARPSPFGGKRPRRDCIQANVIFRPLDGKRSRQRENASFCACRRNDKTGAAIRGSVSRYNIQNIATEFMRDPALSESLRAVKRTV